MFLANSLREKLKRSYLENDADALEKPKFEYQIPKRNGKILLSFRPEKNTLTENILSTQKLKALDKKEWETRFSIANLKSDWRNRIDLNFELKHKKFPDEIIPTEVREDQKYVKELVDRDVLELRQKRWNISSDANEKIRPELKQTLFEVSHGLQDFKIIPLKEHNVEEGVDSRNNRIIDGNKWDISNLVTQKELKETDKKEKEKASENTIKYWKDNEDSRDNEEPFKISEDRKKLEIIRYFKKYKTPIQKNKEYYQTMNKVKNMTNLEKQEIEKKVRYENPGAKYDEKINALVFKNIYNLYRYKYNELTGKLSKEEIKKKQIRENKFKWKDNDLINKMIAVSTMDMSWFKPKYLEYENKACNSQENLRRALLKPLVSKGTDIHLVQDQMREKLEENLKIKQKKEMLLNKKHQIKKSPTKEILSRYPLNKADLDKLTISLQNIDDENDKKLTKSFPLFNTFSNLEDELDKKDSEPLFLNAYKKICEEDTDKKNKNFKKFKDQISFEYKHPGTYREFEYEIKDDEPEKFDPFKKETKNVIKKKFWSCCMNEDENSKGCQKILNKKFRWIYEP